VNQAIFEMVEEGVKKKKNIGKKLWREKSIFSKLQ